MAEAYDRERPGYPVELIDAACSIAGLEPGSRVLEVGCGTGKLTESLVERGLVVDAVDPGSSMIAFARKRVRDSAAVDFHLGRFEEVAVPEEVFEAVFSAAAFHWIVPDVGWAKAARCLRPGGAMALIGHISYRDESIGTDDEALHELFGRYWLVDTWQPLRDLVAIRAGVEERRANVSTVWTWLVERDLDNAGAARLFDDVELTTQPVAREQTADQLWALFATTSAYHRLDQTDREDLESQVRRFFERRGGRIHTSDLAVLVTARRTAKLVAGEAGTSFES